MREVANLNAYLHDFTSALWVCGSVLLFWLGRELRPLEPASATAAVLRRLVIQLKRLTVPGLIITLLSGGGRALMFERWEYGAPLTRDVVMLLIVKHIFFAGVVGWGVWVHAKVRGRERFPVGVDESGEESRSRFST